MLSLIISWLVLWLSSVRITHVLKLHRADRPFGNLIIGTGILLFAVQMLGLFFPLNMLLIPVTALAIWELFSQRGLGLGNFNRREKGVFVLILLVCNIPGVLPVWINDDSSYYLPSIKWFATEGINPGLSQWNIRYGLASSWHLLASVFYLPGISPDRVWNFNGLILAAFLLESLKNRHSVFGLIPVILLCAPFLNAPSPDLPLVLITIYVVINHNRLSAAEWAILVAVVVGLKATGVSLLLVAGYPLLKMPRQFIRLSWLPLLAVFLWMARNQVTSGHLFFPVDSAWIKTTHTLPHTMLQEFRDGVLAEIYGLGFSGESWRNATPAFGQRIRLLFELRPYKVGMNVLILAATLFLVWSYRKEKTRNIPFWSVWFAISLLMWFLLAPNYRFLLGIPLIAGMRLMDRQQIFRVSERRIPVILLLCILSEIWINTRGTRLLRKVSCVDSEPTGTEQLLFPVPYPEIHAEKIINTGSAYYRPGDCIYCGDAPLPCLPDTVKRTHESYGVKPWSP